LLYGLGVIGVSVIWIRVIGVVVVGFSYFVVEAASALLQVDADPVMETHDLPVLGIICYVLCVMQYMLV
jgi:hypothetical protein